RVSSLLLRPRLASSFTRRPRAPAPTLFPYTTLFRSRAEPARYGLLYGGPVPGYAAPPERTTGPGTRVIRVLTAIVAEADAAGLIDRKSTRLNSSHVSISYAVFCLKKKNTPHTRTQHP